MRNDRLLWPTIGLALALTSACAPVEEETIYVNGSVSGTGFATQAGDGSTGGSSGSVAGSSAGSVAGSSSAGPSSSATGSTSAGTSGTVGASSSSTSSSTSSGSTTGGATTTGGTTTGGDIACLPLDAGCSVSQGVPTGDVGCCDPDHAFCQATSLSTGVCGCYPAQLPFWGPPQCCAGLNPYYRFDNEAEECLACAPGGGIFACTSDADCCSGTCTNGACP